MRRGCRLPFTQPRRGNPLHVCAHPFFPCPAAKFCPANYRVFAKACIACPPGTTNAEGDNAAGANTNCDGVCVFTSWNTCQMGFQWVNLGYGPVGNNTSCPVAGLSNLCKGFQRAKHCSSGSEFTSHLPLLGQAGGFLFNPKWPLHISWFSCSAQQAHMWMPIGGTLKSYDAESAVACLKDMCLLSFCSSSPKFHQNCCRLLFNRFESPSTALACPPATDAASLSHTHSLPLVSRQ